MAIAKMHHFKLYSLKSLNRDLLTFLQDFGDVHINNLTEEGELLDSGLEYVSEPEESIAVREEISKLDSVIKTVSKKQEKLGMIESLKRGNKNYTYEELMDQGSKIDTLKTTEKIDKLIRMEEDKNKEIADLKVEIQDLRPWVNLKLSSDQIRDTKNLTFITGYILAAQFEAFLNETKDLEYTIVEKVGDNDKNTYFLAIVEKDEKDKLLELLRRYSFFSETFESEKHPVDEIRKKEEIITKLQEDISNIHKEFNKNIADLDDLILRYEYLNQIDKKYKTANNFLSTKSVSVIDGYLKSSDVPKFEKELEDEFRNEYFLEIQEADKEDPNVPIYLENNKYIEAFEPITKMYSLPRYNEIDPTPFLAPFYWFFFGMMIADIGYGILLLIGTTVLLKFNLSDSMRKNIKFFHYLSYSTIIWGLIYGSFFGGIIELPKLLDPTVDYIAVLVISIVLGTIHMFLGLGLKAYVLIRDGHGIDAFYDVGTWFMVLVGALYWIVSMVLNLPFGNIAKYIMFIGMVLIVLFTGRDAKTKVARFASGAYNLYGISSWVGDFVSYLRLMALGLAGGFIGLAINMIGGTMADSGIIGLIFAVVLFVFGQIFNLALSALSAYVHTLRLTFVEFFGKFYEGGGKKFDKIRNETKYINIRKQEE